MVIKLHSGFGLATLDFVCRTLCFMLLANTAVRLSYTSTRMQMIEYGIEHCVYWVKRRTSSNLFKIIQLKHVLVTHFELMKPSIRPIEDVRYTVMCHLFRQNTKAMYRVDL